MIELIKNAYSFKVFRLRPSCLNYFVNLIIILSQLENDLPVFSFVVLLNTLLRKSTLFKWIVFCLCFNSV